MCVCVFKTIFCLSSTSLNGFHIYIYIYLYYALCFMLIEHSVCHEPIFVLINVFMLLA